MDSKAIPRQKGGRDFDPSSRSARAIRLIVENGLSQSQAAAVCGITQSAVSHAIAARERATKQEAA